MGGCKRVREGGVSTAGTQSALRNQVSIFSLVVDFLLRGPQHQRDIAVIHPLLPHLEGRSFQHITVHHRYWPHKAARSREVKEVKGTPGWVFLPRNGLGEQRTVTGHTQCLKYPLKRCGLFSGVYLWRSPIPLTTTTTVLLLLCPVLNALTNCAATTCSTCWTDKLLRQLLFLQPDFSRNTWLAALASSGVALKMYEPLMSTAALNRPLAKGDTIRVHTEVPPFRRRQHEREET